MTILDAATATGLGTVIIAAVAWLIKSITVHLLSRDIELFKIDLLRESNERQVRFEKAYDEMATTIAHVYALLLDVIDSANEFTSIEIGANDPQRKDAFGRLIKSYRMFQEYFRPRRIWLPQKTATQIWDVVTKIQNVEWSLSFYKDIKSHKEVAIAAKQLSNLRPVISELENTFRNLTGVNNLLKSG